MARKPSPPHNDNAKFRNNNGDLREGRRFEFHQYMGMTMFE